MKRPSFQFYPADWRKDSALQSCSIAARGLWIEIMCIAHECEPYGHLQVNGFPMTNAQIARLVGESEKRVSALLAELEAAGVPSRAENGAIYSRRMVHDERIRNARAEAGRLGGNPVLLNHKVKHRVNRKDNHDANLGLTPSSSSSSSTSVGRPRKRGTPCPPEFDVTEEMSQWAVDQGLAVDRVIPETEKFLDHWRSNGKTKIDWDATWRNWIRKAVEFGAQRGAR